MSGPLDLRQKRFGPWTLTAAQTRRADGSCPFDVYLLHDGGARVPIGANIQADYAGEMARLECLLDWPVRTT